MDWPEFHDPPALRLGTDPGRMRHKWVDRFLRIIDWLIKHRSQHYEAFCFIEADVVLLRPPPAVSGTVAIATVAGYRNEPFRGSRYFHCPWLLSVEALTSVQHHGVRMCNAGLDEQGFIDRFLGLMADLYTDISWQHSRNYSQNTIEPQHIAEAADWARHCDCWAQHGVKTQAAFDAIMAARREVNT